MRHLLYNKNDEIPFDLLWEKNGKKLSLKTGYILSRNALSHQGKIPKYNKLLCANVMPFSFSQLQYVLVMGS